MLNYKKILYATDLHGTCVNTLKRVINFAAKFEAEVTVVHVIKANNMLYGYTAGISGDVDDYIERDAKKKFDEFIQETGFNSDCAHILKGNKVREILNYADEEAIDVIIINGHSHNIFSRMNSTEDCVINNAKCDVIILR